MKVEGIGYSAQGVDSKRRDGKRTYSEEHKRGIVEQCLRPGASVAGVALAHRVNANLVHKWINKHRERQTAVLLPVTVSEQATDSAARPSIRSTARRESVFASIEIELPGGRLRLKGAIDLDAVRALIGMLSGG